MPLQYNDEHLWGQKKNILSMCIPDNRGCPFLYISKINTDMRIALPIRVMNKNQKSDAIQLRKTRGKPDDLFLNQQKAK